ncbi:MAG: glycoside hydrolase family 99-like domain-containing protein [Planctomycetales bacterium]|nr:glycoside hydrolase family 99-like domain-containing protein [Planctomycetales bacterium]
MLMRRHTRLALTIVVAVMCGLSVVDGQEISSTESVQKPLLVGAYYYPWYRGAPREATADAPASVGWMRQAMRSHLVPQQLPALGVYDSASPEVIAAHIAQSRQANLDFWAVSWWGPNHSTDRVLRRNILAHPAAEKLKYAILYESTGRFGPFKSPDYSSLASDFDYLEQQFFNDPRYLKVDGKPVVFIYLTRVYFRNRGEDALRNLRLKHPNLYLIGDEVFGPRYPDDAAAAWDAITAYDVYGQSLQAAGATQAAITQLKSNYEQAREAAHRSGKAFVPAISPGYNDRAVRQGHEGRNRVFADKADSQEGDIFRAMLRQIALPLADDAAQRMVMVTSFNEWYEDSQIEPTQGTQPTTARDDSADGKFFTHDAAYVDYGDLYLRILREETTATAP